MRHGPRDELRRTLYASQMNLVQSAFEADNVARALDILDQQRPKPGEPDLRSFVALLAEAVWGRRTVRANWRRNTDSWPRESRIQS